MPQGQAIRCVTEWNVVWWNHQRFENVDEFSTSFTLLVSDRGRRWEPEEISFIILLVFGPHNISAAAIELHGWFIKLCSCCLWRHRGNRGNWWTYLVSPAAYEAAVGNGRGKTNTDSTLYLGSPSTHTGQPAALRQGLTTYCMILCAHCTYMMYVLTLAHAWLKGQTINTLFVDVSVCQLLPEQRAIDQLVTKKLS